jgi:positive regulator of sigma E activity
MPEYLASANWLYVTILSVFVFIAALLGGIISFRNKVAAALIAALLFAAGFVFWTYYPRDTFPDAIKTLPTSPK